MMSGFGKQNDEQMIFHPLYDTFYLGGHVLPNMPKRGIEKTEETSMLKKIMAQLEIHMIRNKEDDNEQYRLAIRPCPLDH